MTRPRSSRASAARRLVLLAGLVCGVPFVVELGARLAVRAGWVAAPPSAPVALPADADQVDRLVHGLRHHPGRWLPTPTIEDVDLLWRNQPGGRATPAKGPHGWNVIIDGDGYRAVEWPPAAPGAIPYRVLCLGDSVTFGSGVDQPLTYPQQLQTILAQRLPGSRVEVRNGGVQLWTWAQGARFLEERLEGPGVNVVIAGFGTNDQYFPVRETDAERLAARRATGVQLAHRLRPWFGATVGFGLIEPWLDPTTAPRSGPSPACADPTRSRAGCRRLSSAEIEAAVETVVRSARAAGADLVVLNTDFTGTPAAAAARSACRRLGVPFVDVVARVRDAVATEERDASAQLGLSPPGPRTQASRTDSPTSGRRALLRVTDLPAARPARATGSTAALRPSPQGPARMADPRPFEVDLRDDGQGGDESAGDAVWSGLVAVPDGHDTIDYAHASGTTSEFGAVGAGSAATPILARRLRVLTDVVGPVDRYAVLRGMSDGVHPDASGAAIIAGAVASELERLDSWPARRR